MHRGRDRIDEALIRVGCEVHDDLRARRDRADDLDVKHHFAVGVLVCPRRVAAPIDAYGAHARGGDAETLEVAVQICLAKAAA